MARPSSTLADEDGPPEDVEVRVPAVPRAVVTMRTVAADLAARAEFTLDAVADLRMAVDEACSSLVPLARPDTKLTCTFILDEERITVTATVLTPGPERLPTDSFGWRILTTLADDVRMLSSTGDPFRLALRLSVRRLGTELS
ncbi:ATP-binding protein [Actinomycetospora termitidis]|uniref:ATP-binding protein n=1 Tax=Actinomycetospora termitidis TaxID=3053470 RepID=A0ABT7MK23_9PSEU|nr:ATP-binding protein [Actinomycetospora sp. Odt1-22]MDL5160544.1 ATP-binding protein [Actinomycetospora sp. Odt1-22]